MRAILELGGVKDVVGKSLGSRNPINIVYATMEALRQLKDPEVELARRLGRPIPTKEPPKEQPEEESNLEVLMTERPTG
jgi:ribosomal protein S5